MANTYLSRTGIGSSNNQKKWTFSGWFKKQLNGSEQRLITSSDNASYDDNIRFNAGDTMKVVFNNSTVLNTNRLFRDTNAFYHIVVKVDTDQVSANDRVVLYINGVDERTVGGYSTNNQPNQGTTGYINYSQHYIGVTNPSANSNHFNGIMSHVHFTDGYAYTPTSFGETDSTSGEWKIKTDPSVSYGTSGFWILKDGNSVTDSSTNSNAFTVSQGTLTNTEDCPSNVFPILQPAGQPGSSTLSSGSLALDGANENNWAISFNSTIGASSGKYYWEIKLGMHGESTTDYNIMGVCRSDKTWTNTTVYSNGGFNGLQSSNSAGGLGIYSQTNATMGGALYIGGTSVNLTNGDIVSFALDLDNKKMWVGKNGTWADDGNSGNAGNPATGAYPLWGTGEFTTGAIYLPSSIIYYDNSQAYNFGNGVFKTTSITSAGINASGNGIFEYDVPTGFTALSTKGLNL